MVKHFKSQKERLDFVRGKFTEIIPEKVEIEEPKNEPKDEPKQAKKESKPKAKTTPKKKEGNKK